MQAFTAHFTFELRTGIRNKTLLLMNYLFPLGFYLMMGLIMPGINPMFRDVIVPGMVTFAIMASTLLGMPDPLVNARESGIFRSYKINGITAVSLIFMPALTTIMHLAVVTGIIVVTAPLLFDAPLPVHWGYFIVIALLLAYTCAGLAVLIGVIAPNSRMTVLYAQALFLPSMLIGGVMLPYSMLPETAASFAQLLPVTHAMNAFNSLAMGGPADFSPTWSLLALFVVGQLAFFLAWYLFSWDGRNTERRGHPALALLALLPFAIGIFIH
ncbi:MAG: ABC transporter permease [Ardenticatenaceae bacterium]|nr:ABC transporter permease [Ardenticatenaceae bacterium]MCB9445794.1 ABC transporter permease [Ardenticatenaceae bacterium]